MTFSRQGIKDDIVEPVFSKIKIKLKKNKKTQKQHLYETRQTHHHLCLLSEATYAP